MLTRRHQRLVIELTRVMAIAVALLMLTVLVVNRSQAAFSDTTVNPGNSFAAGSVVLTDDDSGTALFTATAMTPGVPVVDCIVVTYSGTLTPADIRMYGTSAGVLAPFLDTTIEIGTGGVFGNCAGFTPTSTLYTGTLDNYSTTQTNWATGLVAFTAAVNPTVQTFRFTVDVQNNPAAQGQSATAAFTFEAQD